MTTVRSAGTDHPVQLPARSELLWYLASSGSWLAAMTLQGFLVQWLLVFHLEVEAMELGVSRALMETPPLVMLLIAGVVADRVDGRRVLIALSVAACLPPLLLAGAGGQAGYWVVVAFGMVMALLQSATDPSRAAMMNRITRIDIQRTVTLTTVVTMFISLGAIWLGGRLESVGLGTVLALQAALFAVSAGAVARLSPQPPAGGVGLDLAPGLRALWRLPLAGLRRSKEHERPTAGEMQPDCEPKPQSRKLVRNVIGINFVSAMFNAGAYAVVVPLIVREVYAGDAAFLASMFIAFTIGSAGSNVVLLFLMPLRRPGRVFVVMQLTRLVILAALWAEPPAWAFFALISCWGVNMGVTSTLARTTVQELAPGEHRAKILAILLASFMVAAPVSALILGFVVELGDAPAGLLPGVVVSLALFLVGKYSSGLWSFESPSHPGATA